MTSDDRRILTASDRALLVESRDLDVTMRLHAALEAAAIPGVCELVPAARTILVRFDPSRITSSALAAALAAIAPVDELIGHAREVTIPVRYDGEDLEEVARHLDLSVDEIVARHVRATWRVAFTGFAPGFGYLVGDDPVLDVPRRASPRTRIPAGSVALAGTFAGVYPRASPGGWQLIGRTDARMWDLDRDPPALLSPGTTVRFEAVEREVVVVDASEATAPAAADGPIEVVRPGLQLLVQDRGRPGLAELGVSAAGVADRSALTAANRAVGNTEDAAALECVGGGAVLRMHAPLVAVVTGAAVDVLVRASDDEHRPALGTPFALESGDELRLGAATRGLRSIIGVRGGIASPTALGSRSTDTLAGLGPAGLSAGDHVPVGDPRTGRPVEPHPLPTSTLPAADELVTLDIVLGPREDWLTPAGLETLLTQEWLVTPRSDRVGVRLEGAVALERASGELPSEGAVTGALQVPPDGQPVLFLADHPLTGGYPIVGAVVDHHLDLAGQLPAGTRLRLRVIQEDAC